MSPTISMRSHAQRCAMAQTVRHRHRSVSVRAAGAGEHRSCSGHRDPSPATPGALHWATAACIVTAASALAVPEAQALTIHAEPANALSLPTWAIHVSSVAEWVTAMVLMWRYAEVSGNPRWKGMAWGMMPALGSAMAACTWHFFYNSSDLDFLVAVQAALTVIGNCTCWLAAYRLFAAAQDERQQA